MGTPTTIYVSLPDASSTCGSWNLPTPPASSTYQCSSPQTYRSLNGSGWIPLNFSSITTGSPIGQLPPDPTNVSSSGLYYTYVTNGTQYEVTSLFESQKYKAQYAQNPSIPNYPEVNARGSSLTVNPLWSTNGLVGYWNLDEGTGTTALDLSGNGNGGTLVNGPSYVTGKLGQALSFSSSSNQYINISNNLTLDSAFTIAAYIKTNSLMSGSCCASQTIFKKTGGGYYITMGVSYSTEINGYMSDGVNNINPRGYTTGNEVNNNSWHNIALVKQANTSFLYYDGNLFNAASSSSFSSLSFSANSYIGIGITAAIDDIRVYNRALSAAEIQALYNAEK